MWLLPTHKKTDRRDICAPSQIKRLREVPYGLKTTIKKEVNEVLTPNLRISLMTSQFIYVGKHDLIGESNKKFKLVRYANKEGHLFAILVR